MAMVIYHWVTEPVNLRARTSEAYFARLDLHDTEPPAMRARTNSFV